MTRSCCFSVSVLLATAMSASSGSSTPVMPTAKPSAAASANRAKLFAWFDTLGYDAIKNGRFVSTNSWWDESMRGEPEVNYGFFVKENAKCFTILTPSLEFLTFDRSGWGREATFEDASFAKWAASGHALSREQEFGDDMDGPLTPRGIYFVVARACDARGLEAASTRFLTLAEKRHSRFRKEKTDFRAQLEDDIATHAVCEAMAWICCKDVSRSEVKARLEQVVRLFPHGPHAGLAKETIAVLGKMIAEDKAHQLPTVPFDQMPIDAQVAELVFQLRDQPGVQNSVPGMTDLFHSSETSPANRLVKLGYAAVPRLLGELHDERFTRAMAMDRINADYAEPVRIEFAAWQILSKVAHKAFWPEGGWSTGRQRQDLVEASIRNWWKQQQSGGERATLIAGVERADEDSPTQAKALVDKYPADAVAAIRIGLSHSTDWFPGPGLIDALMGLNSPEARALAREQMAKGRHDGERLAAARVVSTFDAGAAVSAMISEWNKRKRADSEMPAITDPLVEFLAGSGRADAVEALAHDLRTRGPAARSSVVHAFMFGELPPGGYMNGGQEMHWGYPEHGIRPQAEIDKSRYRDAVEDLLAAELTDTSSNEFRERPCDSAAEEMAKIWPQRYRWFPYRAEPSLSAKDAMRLKSLNTWRGLRGKPLLRSLPASSLK